VGGRWTISVRFFAVCSAYDCQTSRAASIAENFVGLSKCVEKPVDEDLPTTSPA
jgi:hypothetical protein